MLILSNFCTTWIPKKGHIWSQGASKQMKMQQKYSTQYISCQKVSSHFQVKTLKNLRFLENFGQKTPQKVKFENFPPNLFSAIFFKSQKYVSMAKMRNIYGSVWEKQAEMSIFGPNFGRKTLKNTNLKIFPREKNSPLLKRPKKYVSMAKMRNI